MNVQQQFKMELQGDSDNCVKLNSTAVTMEMDGVNDEGESSANSKLVDPQILRESNPLVSKIKTENASSNDDSVENIPRVSNFTLACNAWSVVSYFIFVTGNIRLGIDYWTSAKKEYLIFMIVLIILTSASVTGISAKMLYCEVETSTTKAANKAKKRSRLAELANLKVPFWLAVLFQLDVLLRCVRRLCHALAVRMYAAKGNLDSQDGWYKAMIRDNANLALLNIVRSFLSTAPQLILQLTLFFDQGLDSTVSPWKICTWCITVICLGLAMKTYHCAVRLSKTGKLRITKTGEVFMFLWYCCTIGSRILIVAITASNWPLYTLLACTVNWIGWTTWIYVQKKGVLDFCPDQTKSESYEPTRLELLETALFSAILAVVYMFTAVILKEGSTFSMYCVYYALTIVQNGAMLVLFIYFGSPPVENYLILDASCILAMILFFIGITAMIIYYLFLQPTVKIPYVTCSPV